MTDLNKKDDQGLRKLFQQLRVTPPRDSKIRRQAKTNYLAQIEALGSPTAKPAETRKSWFAGFGSLRPLGMTISSIVLALALLLSGTGIALASQRALPSDALYPVKIAIEDIQLAVSVEDAQDAQLLLGFTQRRLDEISSLLFEERYSDLPLSVDHYNDELLQLATIIIGYIDEDDPRADLLLSLFLRAVADYEVLLSTLLESSPSSASSDIELAIDGSKQASQDPEIVSRQGETNAEFRGSLESLNAQRAQICGIDFSFEYGVHLDGSPMPGDPVETDFVVIDGKFVAASLELELEPEDCQVKLEGRLDQRGDNAGQSPWQLAGVDFFANASTEIRDNPQIGDHLRVRASLQSDGSFLATRIEAHSSEDEEQGDEAKLKDIEPEKGQLGTSINLAIEGKATHFGSNSVVSFSPSLGISFNNLNVSSDTHLSVEINVANDAQLGDRQVIVTTLDEVATGAEFRIEASPQQAEGGGEEGAEDGDDEGGEEKEEKEGDGDGGGDPGDGDPDEGDGDGGDGDFDDDDSDDDDGDGDPDDDDSDDGDGDGDPGDGDPDDGDPGDGDPEDDYEEIHFTGNVNSKSSGSWKIDGKTVEITSKSEVDEDIKVGDEVKVNAFEYPNGTIEAEKIELEED